VEISEENGRGEDTMTTFIQAHFQSILKPFADHVEELHRSMGELGTEITRVAAQTNKNGSALEDLAGQLVGFRTDLGRTNDSAQNTGKKLEAVIADTKDLADEIKRTKAELTATDGRVDTVEASTTDLQSSLKGARSSVGKLREGLGKLERDVAARISPVMDKLVLDLKNLDVLHQATTQNLSEMRSFAESAHQAFLVHEKENEQLHCVNDRRFERVDDQFGELSRALKDMRDMDHLQEEHLQSIDGTITPFKQRVDEIEQTRDDHRRRHNDLELLVTGLQVQSNSMGIDVAKLLDFYEEAKRGDNIFEVVAGLKREAAQNAENINRLLDSVGLYNDEKRNGDDRAETLEKKLAALQTQTAKLADRVGIGTPAHSRSPSREPRSRSQAGYHEFKVGDSSRASIADGVKDRMPVAVMKALDKMSIAARQRRAIDQISEHSRELAMTSSTLSKTACQLDNTEIRVSTLEREMATATEELKRINNGLALNQEYWKGLSKGLKETNRSVNVEGEVLPVRNQATKLPTISRPLSSPHHGPCIMSAR